MAETSIEWTDKVWNPVTGCTKVSQGCKNCYAEGVADRFFAKQYPPNADGSLRQFTDVRCHEDRLDAPLHWKKPAHIFVNSMSDLFHEDVPFEFILAVLAHGVTADWHTYQILTKRPERMLEFQKWMDTQAPYRVELTRKCFQFGVSIEDQATADRRIPLLLQFRCGVRWVSYEPALGPTIGTTFRWCPGAKCQCYIMGRLPGEPENPKSCHYCGTKLVAIDWLVCGGESGPSARPMHPDWARSVRDECVAAGVPFFFKQMCDARGHKIPFDQVPSDLQVRQYPRNVRADSVERSNG